jgi:glycosyltransferase involved in cell wall biosynthesis
VKILHITSWYPHNENWKEALFIQRHIESLESIDGIQQKVIHLNVSPGKLNYVKRKAPRIAHYLLNIPINKWFLIELITFFLISIALIRHRVNSYDIVNFHVAYPNLTFWHWIKWLIKPKVIINEHWSAYHFNFGLKKPPPRIRRIFQNQIPVIAVSKALLSDIRRFSKANFNGFVVPNVVDTSIFKNDPSVKREHKRFFMVAQWKAPKKPLLVIQAFQLFLNSYNQANLIIGGYGPMLDKMKELVNHLELGSNIHFVGALEPKEIAHEMNRATSYIHCSDYETFSVVCAEALCCGCPVIASRVGGIPEFVNEHNGILVNKNSVMAFNDALHESISKEFSVKSLQDFSTEGVGKKYYHILNEIH